MVYFASSVTACVRPYTCDSCLSKIEKACSTDRPFKSLRGSLSLGFRGGGRGGGGRIKFYLYFFLKRG